MTRFSAGPGLAALGSESIVHLPRPTRRWRPRLVSRTWGRGLHICPLGRQWLSHCQEVGVGRERQRGGGGPCPLPEGPVLSDTELSGLLPTSELGGSRLTFRVVPAQPPSLLAAFPGGGAFATALGPSRAGLGARWEAVCQPWGCLEQQASQAQGGQRRGCASSGAWQASV